MPQQLIYTSAQRGVVAGRSGHCTVARSSVMREALVLQLEKLSYYQHLSLSGGQERPIYSSRVLDIRGSRFHVLSKIQDAGLDFTGRTNFLAHHLIFTPEELRQFSSPPIILSRWTGWLSKWNQEPQLLENEDWSGLAAISGTVSVPATTWQQVTGDAFNGYGLLEFRAGIAIRVDNLTEDKILTLLAESLELLELRDPRHDFRATAWQYTFTTSMQEQDNPADFRWRCLHSDNPASNRFAAPDCRPLSDVRATRVTSEEKLFAQFGRQPPRFVIQPQSIRITDGQPARLCARAEGVPSPRYQWFAVDKAGNGQPIANGTDAEIVLPSPPFGLSRYVVRASNSQGDATSEVATLSVNVKPRLVRSGTETTRGETEMRVQPKYASAEYVKSADAIDRQRCRLEAEEAQEQFEKKHRMKKILALCGVVLALVAVAILVWLKPFFSKNSKGKITSGGTITATDITNAVPADSSKLIVEKKDTSPAANTDSPPATSVKKPLKEDGLQSPPAPWEGITIGNVSATTSAVLDGNSFIVNGSGENIFGTSDNFYFLQQSVPNSDSLDFVVRLAKAGNSEGGRQGIMIRESRQPNAAFAFIGFGGGKIDWLHRDSSNTNCPNPIGCPQKLPVFLRLTRQNQNISGAFSLDKNEWIWLGTNQVDLSSNYMVGMAVCAGKKNLVSQAWFDQVEVPYGNQ